MSRNDKILMISLLGSLVTIVAVSAIPSLLNSTENWRVDELHNWIEPSAAVVTALGTVALSFFTIVLARETKRLADVGEQPNVVVTIEPNKHSMLYLDMHVENTGTATAYDIEVTFEPALEITGRDASRRIPLRNISILKPGQSISSSLTGWNELQTKAFAVRTSWLRKPSARSRERLEYSMDLTQLEGISRLGGDPAIDSARAAKKIADTLESLGRGYNKLSVNIFNSSDRAEEERELEERFANRGPRNTSVPETTPTVDPAPTSGT
jgi:hypothetical protein